MLEMLQSGNFGSAPKSSSLEKKTAEKIEPLSIQSFPKEQQKHDEKKKNETDLHLNKAQNLLEELQREEKSGFKIDGKNDGKKSDKDVHKGFDLESKSRDKKSAEEDAYDEDFDDEIEEDLPEGNNEDAFDQEGARSTYIANSGQGITVSQSLGVDPSVDSLALEDYDYIEPVERLQ